MNAAVFWPLVVTLLVFSLITGISSAKLLQDPDTYWHITAGHWIMEHLEVPKTDPFSHSMLGWTWTAHEWLAEVIFATVHQAAGWVGLVWLTSFIYACTLGRLTQFLVGRMKAQHALVLTCLALVMSYMHLLVRPHVFAWALMVFWVSALVDAVETRQAPAWGWLLIIPVWANLHGSFVLGILLACALGFEAVLHTAADQRLPLARKWATFLALAFGASLLTQSGWHGWLFTLEFMRMEFALKIIGEWKSPDFHSFQFLEVWLLLVLAATLAGRLRVSWLRALLVLGLVHLALKHQRNVAVLGLVAPLLMATDGAAHWYATASTTASRLTRRLQTWADPAKVQLWTTLGVLVIAVTLIPFSLNLISPPKEDITPQKALDAAQAAGVTGRVMNTYNLGGYLIYKGIPVYIDGRADMYGEAFLKEYINAVTVKDRNSLLNVLNKYQIGWTLLDKGTPAAAVLDGLPGWRKVYGDDHALVHMRTTPLVPTGQ